MAGVRSWFDRLANRLRIIRVITRVGLDIAKQVFQVHGIDSIHSEALELRYRFGDITNDRDIHHHDLRALLPISSLHPWDICVCTLPHITDESKASLLARYRTDGVPQMKQHRPPDAEASSTTWPGLRSLGAIARRAHRA
jgi:hypothetical protein